MNALGHFAIEALQLGRRRKDFSWRNEFHTGFQQAFGRFLVVDGEYIWKYTHYGYDFSVLGNTPILFPVEWHNSKIPGYAVRATVSEISRLHRTVRNVQRGRSLLSPQVGGIGVTPAARAERASSVSTTTKNSTRPRICNTSPGSRTMDWLQLAL